MSYICHLSYIYDRIYIYISEGRTSGIAAGARAAAGAPGPVSRSRLTVVAVEMPSILSVAYLLVAFSERLQFSVLAAFITFRGPNWPADGAAGACRVTWDTCDTCVQLRMQYACEPTRGNMEFPYFPWTYPGYPYLYP